MFFGTWNVLMSIYKFKPSREGGRPILIVRLKTSVERKTRSAVSSCAGGRCYYLFQPLP
ncbi:unnamed protein product [Amoebophrya sp. A25]|nr:unnamed protein product [Amoebophrya sp. A25]|eukprot:GSA25T00011237001.1